MITEIATEQEIVDRFMQIPLQSLLEQNWGKGDAEHWDVNGATFISGVVVMVDQEYARGYVIEAIDRVSEYVSYAAIVVFDPEDPPGGPDVVWRFMVGKELPDSFVGQEDAAQWGVKAIFGMMESFEDAS